MTDNKELILFTRNKEIKAINACNVSKKAIHKVLIDNNYSIGKMPDVAKRDPSHGSVGPGNKRASHRNHDPVSKSPIRVRAGSDACHGRGFRRIPPSPQGRRQRAGGPIAVGIIGFARCGEGDRLLWDANGGRQ